MSTTSHSHITQLSSWFPKSIPTSTSLSSIDPTNAPALWSSILSASSAAQTARARGELYTLSRVVRGAEASLTIISAQEYLATATEDIYKPLVTQLVFNATLNLQNLETASSIYGGKLDMAANVIFTVAFVILFIAHICYTIWTKNHYFGGAFILGTGIEWVGYLARALSVKDDANTSKFLCQIICLTMAPAFIMAGVYYILAQLLVVHQSELKTDYSIFKPLWFSYIFIFCDIVSLVMQAIGGAIAATSLEDFRDILPGTHIMLSGIAFQVFSMTLFLFLLFHFLFRIYFRANPNIKFSCRTLFDLFFQTENGKKLTAKLDPYYNPAYIHVRQRKYFPYFPLIITTSVLFVYIRCIYRVVELSQGWRGYLIVHEAFVMSLDALMVLLTALIYLPFHPVILFGKDANLSLKVIKQGDDDLESIHYEKSTSSSSSKLSSTDSVDYSDSMLSKEPPEKEKTKKATALGSPYRGRIPQQNKRYEGQGTEKLSPYERATMYSQASSLQNSPSIQHVHDSPNHEFSPSSVHIPHPYLAHAPHTRSTLSQTPNTPGPSQTSYNTPGHTFNTTPRQSPNNTPGHTPNTTPGPSYTPNTGSGTDTLSNDPGQRPIRIQVFKPKSVGAKPHTSAYD